MKKYIFKPVISDNFKSVLTSKLLIPDEGVLARSVWILDKDGKVAYRQIVKELTDEPDYDQALTELRKLL